jgi:hypothetical protein
MVLLVAAVQVVIQVLVAPAVCTIADIMEQIHLVVTVAVAPAAEAKETLKVPVVEEE